MNLYLKFVSQGILYYLSSNFHQKWSIFWFVRILHFGCMFVVRLCLMVVVFKLCVETKCVVWAMVSKKEVDVW